MDARHSAKLAAAYDHRCPRSLHHWARRGGRVPSFGGRTVSRLQPRQSSSIREAHVTRRATLRLKRSSDDLNLSSLTRRYGRRPSSRICRSRAMSMPKKANSIRNPPDRPTKARLSDPSCREPTRRPPTICRTCRMARTRGKKLPDSLLHPIECRYAGDQPATGIQDRRFRFSLPTAKGFYEQRIVIPAKWTGAISGADRSRRKVGLRVGAGHEYGARRQARGRSGC